MPSHTHTAIAAPAPPTRALARLVSSSQGMAGLAWHGMVWLGVRSRYFHNEVRWYLPTQYLKIQFGTICQILAAPPSGSREGLRRKFRKGVVLYFCKKSFILVRHIYWIFRLLRGGRLGCTRASVKRHLWPYALEFSLWSNAITHPHCHCSPCHPHARARSPRLVKPRHGWLGLAWYGMAWRQIQVLS